MPPPTSIAVILNSRAGTASSRVDLQAEISTLLLSAGCSAEFLPTSEGDDLTDIARAASDRAPVVVAGGGDGTVSSVASGLVDSPAALGVLPLGTLNHFAKDIGIPPTLPEAIAVIAAGHVARIDAGSVNGRVFVNNSSIGVYPDIIAEREQLRRQGISKWRAMATATFHALRHSRGVTVDIAVNGHVRTWRTPFVFVGNNEYAIDGFALGKRERVDAGRLFAYLAPRMRTSDLPLLWAEAVLGRIRQSGKLELVPASAVEVRTRMARSIRVAIDGEVETMRTPLRYAVRRGALQVVLPQK